MESSDPCEHRSDACQDLPTAGLHQAPAPALGQLAVVERAFGHARRAIFVQDRVDAAGRGTLSSRHVTTMQVLAEYPGEELIARQVQDLAADLDTGRNDTAVVVPISA